MTEVATETTPQLSAPMPSATVNAARYLRHHPILFLLCSALLLIPCLWHRHIQAGDLGSHLYNAWLSQSVARGLLPGLHLDRQFTNVLFDLILSKSFPYLGAVGTERFAVALSVLLFFWGAFSFASAVARQAAWRVVPLIAMISYGAIFHLGFFNFYLSAAFSLFGLAILVAGSRYDFLLLPVLLILAAIAHPMGAACLVALGIYVAALRWLPAKFQIPVTLFLLLVALALRFYLVHHFQILPREITQYWLLGVDQLIVYSPYSVWIAAATLALCALCVLFALRRRSAALSPWIQFYLAIALTVCFAPGGLFSDQTFGMMGYLPDRGSLYSAVALAALVACCHPPRWFTVAISLLAIVFFAALYRDTAILERREAKIGSLLKGGRVISLVPPIPGSRIGQNHLLDRACIGRCYAYGNYEPSSMQFRLHAEPDNRVVQVDEAAFDAMQDGSYVVQSRDLPLFEIYQCSPGTNDLCIAELHAGQQNGDVPGITARP